MATCELPDGLRGSQAVSTLLKRVGEELAADFKSDRPARVSRAPGRLDVMGGIADYTGSMVCQWPLDREAAVLSQIRNDRQLQVFSFNLLDEHRPFTLRIPLEALATQPSDSLRREFAEPGRNWAAYLAGCVYVLHEAGLVDLRDPNLAGLNLAVYSTVPAGAGVSSSAALEVATMTNLAGLIRGGDWPSAPGRFSTLDDPIQLALLCQRAENEIVGAPCGVMDQMTCMLAEAATMFRMLCQPHRVLPPLNLPHGTRLVGINSRVRHSVGGHAYRRTRCAAFMGHRMIVEIMREMGARTGRELIGDPLHGYLANLDPDDYKRLFRPSLPQSLSGAEFIERYSTTSDVQTAPEPGTVYAVRNALDHHVLEARRVRRFAELIEQACAAEPRGRGSALDRAGHLMYASHQSYSMDAMLGAPECDLLVQLARARERAGIYGARITGGGAGGTVVILCNRGQAADAAIEQITTDFEQKTGLKPEAFNGASDGAHKTPSFNFHLDGR